MTTKIISRLPILTFIITLLLYAHSLPTFNVGYADSDEFLTTAYTFGLAHPPGYSLYTTILSGAMNLPIPATTPAWRAHSVSALSSALALSLLTYSFNLIYLHYYKQKIKDSTYLIAAITTIIALATANHYWLYSQITEKYIFSMPLIAAGMAIGFKLYFERQVSTKQLILLGSISGLLVAHHQANIFFLPFLAYALAHTKTKKKVSAGLTLLGSFLVPILIAISLIIIQNNSGSAVSWYKADGVSGLFDFVTRKDFQGTIYMLNTESSGYFPSGLTLEKIFTALEAYFLFLIQNFGITLLITVPFIVQSFMQSKKRPLIFLLAFVTTGPLLAAYLTWPPDSGSQAITQRFYLTSLLTFAPLLFIGFVIGINRFKQALSTLGTKSSHLQTASVVFPLLFIIIALVRYPSVKLNSFDLISTLYQKILTTVKPDSIVTCYSDSSCFALLYEQNVNKLRPDVTIIPVNYPLVKRSLDFSTLQGFSYTDNPYLLFDIITWNIGKRPVYAVDLSQYYFSMLGINNGFLFYIPSGYAGEFAKTMPETITVAPYTLTDKYRNLTVPKWDLMRRFLVESVSQTHVTNAFTFLKRGERTKAQQELNQAVDLSYQLYDQEKQSAQMVRTDIEKIQADELFAPGISVPKASDLMAMVPDLYEKNLNNQALTVVRGAIIVDPSNVPARLELARIYEKMGDRYFAHLEYSHVLLLDPENAEAQQKSALLSQ
jgi:hypothetical protein